MARRKHMARREPNGRPQREHVERSLLPPMEMRRMLEAASVGLRSAEWGTMLGRLYMAGQISELQFAAGIRWSDLVEEYSKACCSPRAPQSPKLDPAGGKPLDPESAAGAREARRHAYMVEQYEASIEALNRTGSVIVRVVGNVCERGQAPAGYSELDALKIGLQTLAAFWMTKPKGKAGAKPKLKPGAKPIVVV